MKYAVIQTGGKQYRVSEGQVIDVELLKAEKDQRITFAEVLLHADGEAAKVGTPFVEGMSVTGIVVDHVKGDKIRVSKYKAKVRYRRTTGHRQQLTRIKIETIHDGKPKREAKVEADTKVTEATVPASIKSESVAEKKSAKSTKKAA